MNLARVLQNGLGLKSTRGEPSADAICGSIAGHFVVNRWSLSFYQADGPVPLRRIALAVLLKKVCSIKNPVGWDDQQLCVVSPAVIEGLGVTLDLDGTGETALDDVNRLHVSMNDVSIGRLAALVVGVVKNRKVETFTAAELAALYDVEFEAGKINAQDIQAQGLTRLEVVRAQGAYAKHRQRLENALR